MAYVPNNLTMFTAAFAGALAGMGASDRNPTDDNPADYVGLTTVAGAFAQSFDTEWGAAATTDLSVQAAQQLCEVAWQDKAPLNTAPFNTPANYTGLSKALIAMISAGAAYYTAEGIPNPSDGTIGGNGLIVTNLAALSLLSTVGLETNATAKVSSLAGTEWRLDKASTQVVDGITCINANGGGRWLRNPTSVSYYTTVTEWWINNGTGNDENPGTLALPLKTGNEVSRRLAISGFPLVGATVALPTPHQQVVVNVQDSMAGGTYFDLNITLPGGGLFAIAGTPTVLATDVVSAVTPLVRGTTVPLVANVSWTINGTAILDFTPYINKRLRITNSANPANIGQVAYIGKNVAGQAFISAPSIPNGTTNLPQNILTSSPTYTFGAGISVGDTFVIESLPDVYIANINARSTNQGAFAVVGFQDINLPLVNAVLPKIGNSFVTFKACTAACTIVADSFGTWNFTNCGITRASATIRNRSGITNIFGGMLKNGPLAVDAMQVNIDFDLYCQAARILVQGGQVKIATCGIYDVPGATGDAIQVSDFGGNLSISAFATGAVGVYGTGNGRSGINIGAGKSSSFTAGQENNITVVGAATAIRLGGSNSARGFDDTANGGLGGYTDLIPATWANFVAALPAGGPYVGLGANAHNPLKNCSLVAA